MKEKRERKVRKGERRVKKEGSKDTEKALYKDMKKERKK
jgi:hypothetical protein